MGFIEVATETMCRPIRALTQVYTYICIYTYRHVDMHIAFTCVYGLLSIWVNFVPGLDFLQKMSLFFGNSCMWICAMML